MSGQPSSSGWAVRVDTRRPVSAGAMAWRGGDRWSLTVFVKSTFTLVEEGMAALTAPAPLFTSERLGEGSARSSSLAEPDIAPYKPQVDVTFRGSVHAAHPVQALRARIAVIGADESLDKSLQVVGDRASAGAPPRPFRRMQLGWDRTWASPDNPIGVAAGTGAQANLVDPRNPAAAVGFGPVARAWPARARLLGGLDPRWLDAQVPHLPRGFLWEFFQAAPRDQRLARLRGTETIILENLLEGRPRLRTTLPGVKACARLYAPWCAPEGLPVDLVADSLSIDGDEQSLSVVWRAAVPLPDGETSLAGAHVTAGLEMPGFPMPWPAPRLSEPLADAMVPAVGVPSEALQRIPAGTMASASDARLRSAHDTPPRHPSIAVIGPPPPPPGSLRGEGAPLEEATRQISVQALLHDFSTDEQTATIDVTHPAAAPPPASIPASIPQSTGGSTMAFTPEQASAMLASVGRHATPGGGFPPPLAPSRSGFPPPPPPVVFPHEEDDEESIAAGATMALTPEMAQRMIEDAARKIRR